jgi:hypothetical protein
MNLTLTFLTPLGAMQTVNTDDSHVAFFQSGLTFNDGTNQDYIFQPWSRILRIISNPSVPQYP